MNVMDNIVTDYCEQDYKNLQKFSSLLQMCYEDSRGLTVSEIDPNEYKIFLETTLRFCNNNSQEHLRFLKETSEENILHIYLIMQRLGFLHSHSLIDQFFPIYTQEQKALALLCLGPIPETELRSFTDKPVSYFINKVVKFCEKEGLNIGKVNPYETYEDAQRQEKVYPSTTPSNKRGPKPRPKKPMKVTWVELVITQETMKYITSVLPLCNFKEWYGYERYNELGLDESQFHEEYKTLSEKMFTKGAKLTEVKNKMKIKDREILLKHVKSFFAPFQNLKP